MGYVLLLDNARRLDGIDHLRNSMVGGDVPQHEFDLEVSLNFEPEEEDEIPEGGNDTNKIVEMSNWMDRASALMGAS